MAAPASLEGSLLAPTAGVTAARRRIDSWLGPRWLPILAAVVGLLVAGAAVRGTIYWPGRVFPGFFVLENGVVPPVGLYGWSGIAAHVPFHSRVTAVDGRPVRTSAEIYDRIAALPEGTPVAYTLEKNGRALSLTVPSMRFGMRDYWLTVGLYLVNGLLYLGAGVVVCLLQPRTAASRAFLLMGVVTGLFALTATAVYRPGLPAFTVFHLVTQATFAATFIHFALVFPVPRLAVVRRPRLLLLPYVVGALLVPFVLAGYWADPPRFGPLYAAYLYSALGITTLIALLVYAYWECRTPVVRRRLHAVLPGTVLGMAVALFGFVDMAQAGGEFLINLTAVTPVLFYLSIGYAVARHDLFDIDRLLKQTTLYLTLTLAITATYAGALVLLGAVVPRALVQSSPYFHLAFVVLVAFLFHPLRERVQRVIDRTFFRERVDYRRTVGEVAAALTSLLDLEEILARVGRTVTEGLAVASATVLLWLDGTGEAWRRAVPGGTMERLPPDAAVALRQRLEADGGRPWAVPADEGTSPDDGVDAARTATVPDAVLFVPLTLGADVVGAFALGPKRSGLGFTREEVDLLRTLAAQSAIAIQNARSYAALAELNAGLESKVAARTAELLASNAKLEDAYHQLQSAQAQVLQTEKLASLGQLVAGVAHEINNPISFIVGNVEPLRERLVALRALAARHADQELTGTVARIAQAFDVIARGAERTAGIVNDLRTFSRVGETLARPVDVHDGLDVTLRLLRPRWAKRITIHRDYGTLPPVEAVPVQLNQVFMNLLANACDAIPEAGNIWIHTACDGDWVTLTIRDDGAGIAPEHLPRIFDPFFTTKPQGKGTGLGLSISHGIVMSHGGRLRVQSEPGRGAEFVMVIPVLQPADGG